MKNGLILLGMLFFACTALLAQPQGPRGVNLDEIPGITAEQKEKVQAEITKQRETMMAAFQEGGFDGNMDEMRAKMEALRTETNKKIAGILTEEQFKVYAEKEAALRPNGPGGGGGGPR